MDKDKQGEEGQVSKPFHDVKNLYEINRKRAVAIGEVRPSSSQTLAVSELSMQQKPNREKVSPRFSEQEKGKKVMQGVELQPRKPHTKATNKLRLKSKVVLNPSLKDLIIDVDEDSPVASQKAHVSKIKLKGNAAT